MRLNERPEWNKGSPPPPPPSRPHCSHRRNVAFYCAHKVKKERIDMQISYAIGGHYHNALHLVRYSHSNGQIFLEGRSVSIARERQPAI